MIVSARESRNPRVMRALAGPPRARALRDARGRGGAAALVAGMAVVVVHEDLLERRLPADQCAHRVPGEGIDDRSDAAADFEPQGVRPGRVDLHPGQWRKLRHPVGERDLHRLRAQVAQLRQGALVDQPAFPEDADPVAERLDLAEDVRGEEDRLPTFPGLAYALP